MVQIRLRHLAGLVGVALLLSVCGGELAEESQPPNIPSVAVGQSAEGTGEVEPSADGEAIGTHRSALSCWSYFKYKKKCCRVICVLRKRISCIFPMSKCR